MHAIAWFTATQKDLVFFQRVTIFYLIYILFVEITLNYDLWMCNSAILRWMYTKKENESRQDYLPYKLVHVERERTSSLRYHVTWLAYKNTLKMALRVYKAAGTHTSWRRQKGVNKERGKIIPAIGEFVVLRMQIKKLYSLCVKIRNKRENNINLVKIWESRVGCHSLGTCKFN